MIILNFIIILMIVISIDKRITSFLQFGNFSLLYDISLLTFISLIMSVLCKDIFSMVVCFGLVISLTIAHYKLLPNIFNNIAVMVLSVASPIILQYFNISSIINSFPWILIMFSFCICKKSLLSVIFIIIGCILAITHGLATNTHTGVPILIAEAGYVCIFWIIYIYRLITYDVKKTEKEDN